MVHSTTDIFGSPGVAKALVEAHHSPDIIHVAQLKEPIPYQLLVFDGVGGLNDRQVAMLERFVRGGGMLLSVGATAQNPGMPQLLGIEVVKDRALRDEGHVLLADGSPACFPAIGRRCGPPVPRRGGSSTSRGASTTAKWSRPVHRSATRSRPGWTRSGPRKRECRPLPPGGWAAGWPSTWPAIPSPAFRRSDTRRCGRSQRTC